MFYLGTITGASGAYNNRATGASGIGTFTIPPTTKSVYLVPSASGILFELGAATGISFQTSAGRGAQLAGPGAVNGPYEAVAGENVVVSIYNSQGGFVSVRVFSSPNS